MHDIFFQHRPPLPRGCHFEGNFLQLWKPWKCISYAYCVQAVQLLSYLTRLAEQLKNRVISSLVPLGKQRKRNVKTKKSKNYCQDVRELFNEFTLATLILQVVQESCQNEDTFCC